MHGKEADRRKEGEQRANSRLGWDEREYKTRRQAWKVGRRLE